MQPAGPSTIGEELTLLHTPKNLLARPLLAIQGSGQSGAWPMKGSRRGQPGGPSVNVLRRFRQSCPSGHLQKLFLMGKGPFQAAAVS